MVPPFFRPSAVTSTTLPDVRTWPLNLTVPLTCPTLGPLPQPKTKAASGRHKKPAIKRAMAHLPRKSLQRKSPPSGPTVRADTPWAMLPRLPVIARQVAAGGRAEGPPGGWTDCPRQGAHAGVGEANLHAADVRRGGERRIAIVGARPVLKDRRGPDAVGVPRDGESGMQRLGHPARGVVGPHAPAPWIPLVGAPRVVLVKEDRRRSAVAERVRNARVVLRIDHPACDRVDAAKDLGIAGVIAGRPHSAAAISHQTPGVR